MIRSLFDKLTEATIVYLNLQIKDGVDALQIFDSWSSVLTWNSFRELSLSYLRRIVRGLESSENSRDSLRNNIFSFLSFIARDRC